MELFVLLIHNQNVQDSQLGNLAPAKVSTRATLAAKALEKAPQALANQFLPE